MFDRPCTHKNLKEFVIQLKQGIITYLTCQKCGSIWLDREEVRKLSAEYAKSSKSLVSDFACPRCKNTYLETMDIFNSNRVKAYQCRVCDGIQIDIQEKEQVRLSVDAPVAQFVNNISVIKERSQKQKKADQLPKDFIVENARAAGINCPSCSAHLTRYSVRPGKTSGMAEFEICDSCFGIWLDREDMVKIPDQADKAKLSVEMESVFPTQRNCPKCDQIKLVSLKYNQINTVIDCCPLCFGTWLDGGELQEISQYLGKQGQEVIDILIDNAIFHDPVLCSILMQFSRKLYQLDYNQQQQEQNIKQAREIQVALIFGDRDQNPLKPQVYGDYKVLSHWHPAKVVGGDYYATIPFSNHGNDYLGICIADVSGKGLPASLLMANLQALLLSFAPGTLSPANLCNQINSILYRYTTTEKFITFFYGVLNMKENSFTYCNAGHNPQILISENKITWLKTGGTVLSFFPDWEYQEENVLLQPKDRILLYTDGVSEAENIAQEEFGEGRIARLLKSYKDFGVIETMQNLTRDIQEFTRGYYRDDTTMLILERAGKIDL